MTEEIEYSYGTRCGCIDALDRHVVKVALWATGAWSDATTPPACSAVTAKVVTLAPC
jgi:hypothetical protein